MICRPITHSISIVYTIRTVQQFSSQVRDNGNIRWSQHCYHAVTHATLHPKTEVEIIWQAPSLNTGCVLFRAMVLEYKDIWYMDDGALSKKFCQLSKFYNNFSKSVFVWVIFILQLIGDQVSFVFDVDNGHIKV